MAKTTGPQTAEPAKTAGSPEQSAYAFTPAAGFPPPEIPTIYADGVANVYPTIHTTKMYLTRADSEIGGKAEIENHAIAQLVMPIDGFVQTTVFFNKVLDGLIASNVVDKQTVEAMKLALSKT
ncbi:MAG: hypothetical protein WAU78_15745 [Roseiarcus sp.]